MRRPGAWPLNLSAVPLDRGYCGREAREIFNAELADAGFVTTVEGYTYGDEWPKQIEQVELYELSPGMELMTPPGGLG